MTQVFPLSAYRGGGILYQLLHASGCLPPQTPQRQYACSARTSRASSLSSRLRRSRYDLACQPVRDLLVDYLRERAPRHLDYNTLTHLCLHLGVLVPGSDLEVHHPGISSLRLAPDIAAAWKQRIGTKTSRSAGAAAWHGQVIGKRDLRGIGHARIEQSARLLHSTWPSGPPTTRPGGALGGPC